MARESYQEKLDSLEEDVLYMGEVVLDRLRDTLVALENKDEETAERIIETDDEVNQLYLDIEQQCIDLFALQQPVAGDLRFIAASFKIITDLERVADLATNLGQYTLDAERDVFPEVDIQEIGAQTIAMIEDALDAYAEWDTEACYEVAARDDEVDERCTRASELVVRDLIEGEHDAPIEDVLSDVSRLLLTIRDLERVGDHGVNIAARALYMIENDDELIL
ncbi:phosphate signaling complex protein PhoU [Haloarchaeobius amylolyticus]|uniref:phosphate signaling complex protein PhoU n=1 Tax=Haloarchaeobius amylolyticus TaxID=1198296 RepID=UPI0022717363|nr:phosphate signaling complex protein PhoU [Haloarchaeobius amylolyticus]